MEDQRKPYHHGDLASALLVAGRKYLAEKGLDGLSLRVVAAEVGVSAPALYGHFRSKKDLVKAICADGFRELADEMEVCAIGDLSATERVTRYGLVYVQFSLNNPEIYRAMFVSGHLQVPERQKEQSQNFANQARRAYRLLEEGFKPLSHSDQQAKVLAARAWALVHGLASLFNEGLLSLPETGKEDYIRTLLASRITQQVSGSEVPSAEPSQQ
ncbi:TetR/AcrR family transcriptional regulator [Flexibacterium corallicola]|uniref:TetR/AcrR family transcriptional regulator n=1 Tax=Flexibacterium corallicola TaxID=3037259 RepID=UPI00286EC83D|nr:TetR/AcrR family transcriptional regulator [Pseudovibrio sp. M1P-2-3]